MSDSSANDRIFPATRWVAGLVIPFLVAAFGILYFFPGRTEQLFAWKLQPAMSAMMLGAAYAGGIYFFSAVLLSKKWHQIKAGFLPVTAFASILGIATILHWDRFNHSHISFYAWTGLYFTTPFIVVGVWLRNRSQDPRRLQTGDLRLHPVLRALLGAAGAITLLIGALLFLAPKWMMEIWPWTLSPLTARVVSAMFALPGIVGLGLALDERWSAARILLQSQAFSIALILIAGLRTWGDFDPANPGRWLFFGGMLGMLLGIVLLYTLLEILRMKHP